MDKLIETKNLYTNFYTFEGVVKALNGVGIVVRRGETYALVGESGCGKSVTVRSMMRIIRSPGRIMDGSILFFPGNQTDKQESIDLLRCSEFFMQKTRGNDISMIFQEAGTALNPVFTVGSQVAESFVLHRKREMLSEAINGFGAAGVKAGQGNSTPGSRKKNFFSRTWQKWQLALFKRELAFLEQYESRMNEIGKQLYELEEKSSAEAAENRLILHKKQEKLTRSDFLVVLMRKLPFLKTYRKPLEKIIQAQVISLLTKLGIPNPDNVFHRYPHELSGGMQQRIIIAIALACNPILLIADEPTSNLDVTIQAQILDLIKKLKTTQIASVLFITHDLGVVAEICDRVSVMYAGDVMETGSVQTIFSHPLHPYTKGLLHSLPKMNQTGVLDTIPGHVPNLIAPPAGCRFHPRCPHVMDICTRVKPPVVFFSSEHSVSCYLYPQKESYGG